VKDKLVDWGDKKREEYHPNVEEIKGCLD